MNNSIRCCASSNCELAQWARHVDYYSVAILILEHFLTHLYHHFLSLFTVMNLSISADLQIYSVWNWIFFGSDYGNLYEIEISMSSMSFLYSTYYIYVFISYYYLSFHFHLIDGMWNIVANKEENVITKRRNRISRHFQPDRMCH